MHGLNAIHSWNLRRLARQDADPVHELDEEWVAEGDLVQPDGRVARYTAKLLAFMGRGWKIPLFRKRTDPDKLPYFIVHQNPSGSIFKTASFTPAQYANHTAAREEEIVRQAFKAS
jgi:hypothetical protein